jgi:hypothetical protein
MEYFDRSDCLYRLNTDDDRRWRPTHNARRRSRACVAERFISKLAGKVRDLTMATVITSILVKQPQIQELTPREEDELDNWFSRCSKTLHFTARLILGDSEMAETAVQSCRFRASRTPPGFESEGPFRSWLLRLLISEALSILDQRHTEATGRRPPDPNEQKSVVLWPELESIHPA